MQKKQPLILAAHVVEHELLKVGEEWAGPIGRQRQQMRVAQARAARDLPARVDAVLTACERGRLQLGQIPEAHVQAMQLGCGPLKPGVAAQQPGNVCVNPERLDCAFGRVPREPREAAAREEIGELRSRPSAAGGDSYHTCHVMLLSNWERLFPIHSRLREHEIDIDLEKIFPRFSPAILQDAAQEIAAPAPDE
jgi:hypothetical protein